MSSDTLLDLVEQCLGPSGLLAVMGEGSRDLRLDVPAASAVVALLHSSLLAAAPIQAWTDDQQLPLRAGLWRRSDALVLQVSVATGDLDLILPEVAAAVPSGKFRQLPGILALAYSIEPTPDDPTGSARLWPEWWAVYFVNGSAEHAVPVLVLRAMLSTGHLGDWVEVALERAVSLGLPCGKARAAARSVVVRRSPGSTAGAAD